MKGFKSFKFILNNNSGIALLMIISTITILGALMLEFRFDTGINKIKAHNMQRKTQAKLNAESGLHIAMARLSIYKEAYNSIQKNSNLKSVIKPEILNQIWSLPLAFPIPDTGNFGVLERTMIERFEKSSLLEGELNVSIQSISNRININLLRTSAFLDLIKEQNKKQNTPGTTPPSTNPPDPNDPFAPKPPDPKPPEPNENEKEKENPIEHLEKRLIELIQVSIDKKIEEDENFELLHGNTDVEELVASIKYFISDPNTDVGPLTNQIVSEFQKNGIEPKNAPLTSISELYLLPGWTHEIIELIKNDITVHGEAVIDLNKLTGQLLKALFPELTDEDITEFFKNKNNPETNVYFNTIDELKNYFVENTRVLEKSYADERVELFVKAGIKFGSAPLLFRIVSTGKYQDTNYTLNVIATIPTEMEEVAPPQTGAGGTGGSTSQPGSKPATPPTGTTGQTGEKKPPNTIFKQPKIVMYLVN